MSSLLEMAEAVGKAAGWHRIPRQVDSAVEFELEGQGPFKLLKPGDRLAAFTAQVIASPTEPREADELARRLGQLAAAAFSSRRSTLFLSEGNYWLYLTFDPSAVLSDIPELCAEFLNDLDWWRHNSCRN